MVTDCTCKTGHIPRGMSYFLLLIGAHSHIRGLGLDDALEARQVRTMFFFLFF